MSELERTAGTVEVLQHWRAEGVEPLDAVIESFRRDRPNVTVSQRTVPVSKLRLTAKSEVLRGDPPDLWVEWPGKNLRPTVQAGVVADVTDLWARTGLVDHVVSGARDAARFDDRFRCVPTDMYRINNLFYNVELAERAGVDVDRLDEPRAFVEALDALADVMDAPPVAMHAKEPYGPLQLWETLVIAYGGRETYEDLIEGRPERHRDVVERAVATLADVMTYAPEDVAFHSSQESDTQFVDGVGAVTHNGGWAIGRIKSEEGFDYGTDWASAPFPGTRDVYQMNMNAVVPAAGSADDDAVGAFLGHLSTPESLAHVTDHLGAVPPRDDVDVRDLHPAIQRHHSALGTAGYHAPSMAHGLGVPPETLIDLKAAIVPFVSDRDVEATTRALIEALG